jgi:hypothetical protein
LKKIFNFAAQNGMTSLDFQNIVIMNLEKLVAVAGISGVFRLVANRNNGLIIEDLDTGKRSFASSRKHQFTPLETIGIFIDNGETEELKVIFQKIKDTKADNPPCESDASAETVRSYFGTLLPNYDKDKVLIGDMKKVIKWFNFLEARGYLDATEPVVEAEIVE